MFADVIYVRLTKVLTSTLVCNNNYQSSNYIIMQVPGERYVYQFVCSLKDILGYNAAELKQQVDDCIERRKRQMQKRTFDEYLTSSTSTETENSILVVD